MAVAGEKFQAPNTPSLGELATQALDGDDDALRVLVARFPADGTLTELLDLFVPDCEVARVFDRFCDAWSRAKQKALLDTLELPVIDPSNLNVGWQG